MSELPLKHWVWHYRLLRQQDGSLGVHEVYQDKRGNLKAYRDTPLPEMDADDTFASGYRIALRKAQERPILERRDIADLQVLPTD